MTLSSPSTVFLNLTAAGYSLDAATRVWARLEESGIAYSDGDEVETRIGDTIAAAQDVSLFSPELRQHQTDWPSVYHLSATRANLLRPIGDLFASKRVLEIGAGCGAITRYLGEAGADVLALEGSARRARIAAERCRDLPGVTVLNESFHSLVQTSRFDVVTLIGVLEYARIYTDGVDPIQSTLSKALELLADDGVLVVAIENQLGLKYFAGAHEDHLGRAMAGIQDHYDENSVVTFGRSELEQRLASAGYTGSEVALPFPDYKLPQAIVLPAGYAPDSGFDAASLAGQSVRADRQLPPSLLFSMSQAFGVLGRNHLLSDLSNSFLVLARKSASSPSFSRLAPALLAEHFATDRHPAFVKSSSFIADSKGIQVKRSRLCPGAIAPDSLLLSHRLTDEPYFSGAHYLQRLEFIMSRPGWTVGQFVEWLKVWRDALAEQLPDPATQLTSIDSPVPGSLIDALPRNLIISAGTPRFFDLEWQLSTPLSYGYMLFRALLVSLDSLTAIAPPAEIAFLHVPTLLRKVFRQMGMILTGSEIQTYLDIDAAFHDEVTDTLKPPLTLPAFDSYVLPTSPRIETFLQAPSSLISGETLVDAANKLCLLRDEQRALREQLIGGVQHVEQLERHVGNMTTEAELKRGEAQRDIAQALLELEAKQQHVAELERHAGNLSKTIQTISSDHRSELDEATTQLATQDLQLQEITDAVLKLREMELELHSVIDDKDSEIGRLWQITNELQSGIDDVSRLHLAARDRIDALDVELAEAHSFRSVADRLTTEMDIVKRSRSWRLTAPLRAVGFSIRQSVRSTKSLLGRMIERAYRSSPLPPASKRKIKGGIFRLAKPFLMHTNAYQRWHAHQRTHAVDSTMRQLFAPVLDFAPMERTLQDNCLWEADGILEYSDYPLVRQRIDATAATLRGEKEPKPLEILNFAARDALTIARELKLPPAGLHPEVTILIPAFNHLTTTLECIASIAANFEPDGPSFEVLIADDASTDDTATVLQEVQNLRIVTHPTNQGFLRNCNAAASHARGRYLLLLNNDVQVNAGWLTPLVDCMREDAAVGAVGPKIVYPSGWLQEAGTSLRRDGTAEMVGLNDLPDRARFTYSRDVDYCSGACLLVRMEDFQALGGFDDAYAPAYCEDSDLCMRLRSMGRRIRLCAESTVVHHLSKTSNDLPSEYKLSCISRNLATFSSRWRVELDRMDAVRTIAFYLPQFHPVAENDLWWGAGFTEWTNVTKARPNYVGHYQPRIPADLGYYDLRLTEVMEKQAELAKRYGLGGFCFYYYWFAGKRLLERPIEQMLATGKPDFPFCLCWANENWTRRWDGQEQDVLMAQKHSDEDDLGVIRDLMRYFRSANYIRIDGRPLILVYRVTLFPDFALTAAFWRQVCRDEGIGDIYIAQVESFELVSAGITPSDLGCDAAVEFPPQGMAEPYPVTAPLLNSEFEGAVADYRDLAVRYATRDLPPYKRFMGVMPGWDNTARRQNNSYSFEHATPGAFQAWLETTIARTKQQFSGDERLVFVNAWNEWAEGAYLEPDRRFGHSYLQALANAHDSSHLVRNGKHFLQ